MIVLFIFALSILGSYGGKSPYGEQYLESLTPEKRREISADVAEDLLLDAPGLIHKYGYPVEIHEIKTEDGYLLTVHRIPSGKSNDSNIDRCPVLLMHGLMSSSADFIVYGPDRGLGYLLADQGYDVWLPNARGNYYSRKHVSLDTGDADYWSFSWHEIGYYDIPAVIDYVLQKTVRSKLHYIGHSQGTTTFFVLGSTRPEYNEKIISMHALSPIAYMAHMRNVIAKKAFEFVDQYDFVLEMFMQNEYDSHSISIFDLKDGLCNNTPEFVDICTDFYDKFNNGQINMTKLPVLLSHFPAGASVKQVKHYAQLYACGKFQQFDRGAVDNVKIYGKDVPPVYDLGRITSSVLLYYATNDDLADLKDIERLSHELNNTAFMYNVKLDTFSHYNFLVANDIKVLLYDTVLSKMKLYENNL